MKQEMSVLTSSLTEEWYTPPLYIDLARRVLGGIDLDPASNDMAQSWIRAETYYKDQGLSRPWFGRVWCNPPYGKSHISNQSNQSIWSSHMANLYVKKRIDSGLLLINSTHGYNWYEYMWTRFPCCLLRDRIRFIKPDGTVGGQAKRGQTVIYFGDNTRLFTDVFESNGRVLIPTHKPDIPVSTLFDLMEN